MGHDVQLDDDVFRALQRRAKPLVDDINSVLRRVLGISPPDQAKGPKDALPDQAFERPLLVVLINLGGSGPTKKVIDEVGKILADRLGDADWMPLATSNEPRWRNRVQFARLALVKSGDMVAGSPRGIWEITDKGRATIEGDGR